MSAWAQRQTSLPNTAVIACGLTIGVLAGIDPTYAVVAALGLVFVALVLAEPAAGVALLASVALFEAVSLGPLVSFAKVTGALLVVSWLALLTVRPERTRELTAEHPAFTYALVAFVGWVAVSSAWAEDSAATYGSVFRYGLNAMLFLIVFSCVRTEQHVKWVLAGFVVGSAAGAAYGLIIEAPVPGERLAGSGTNANETAALLVAAAALAAALSVTLRNRPALALAAALAVPACAYGVLLTLSRGGLVALVAALVAAIVVAGRWRGAVMTLVIVAALGTVVYFGTFASPDATARVTSVEGGTGRVDIWKVAWRMVEAEPLRGIGSGNFPQASVHYLLEPGAVDRSDFIVDNPKVAHNTYLEVLAELGIVGLALFLAIVGFALICNLKAIGVFKRAANLEMEAVSRALFVAVVGLLAAAFFGSRQYQSQLWLLLSLGPTLLAIGRSRLARPTAP